MKVTKKEIANYLKEVKKAIKEGKCNIEYNNNGIQNKLLYIDYVVDEDDLWNIILDLKSEDFSTITQNRHKNYLYKKLYIFGKDVNLLNRFTRINKLVTLYIKINKLLSGYVIIVSIHEAAYPIKYYFK